MSQYKRRVRAGERYWYKFDYQGKTYSSKAIYLTKGEAKKAEAERFTGLEAELRQKPMTFKVLCEKRLDYLKAAKTDSYYTDNRLIMKPLVAKFGHREARDIQKSEFIEYLTDLSKKLKSEGKDNYAVNFNIRVLKALFYYAQDTLEVVERNPIRGIKPFPVNKKLKYIPPDKDIKKVISLIKGERLNMFLFVMETGARISEALRATTADFKGDNIILWTRKSKNGNLVPRLVPFTKPLLASIWPTDGRLFNSWIEQPRWLEDLCNEHKIKQFGWHSLRHRKASLLAREHKDIVYIRDFLGHSSVNTTNLYLQSLSISCYDSATES